MTTVPPGTDETVDRGGARDGEGAVLVPVLSAATSAFVVEAASALADSRDAELILASTDTAPPLSGYDGTPGQTERRIQLAERARRTSDVTVGERHYPGTGLSRVVADTVDRRAVDTVVVDRPDGTTGGRIPGSTVERIDTACDCDVAVMSGRPPMGTVSSILLAVAGGPHSWSAAGFAADVAATEGAWVDVMHVVSPDAGAWRRARGRRIIGTAMDRLAADADEVDDVDEWLYEADDVADVLVEQSRYYDLIVMGAPRKSRLREFVSGSTTRDVRQNAGTAVVTVRRAGQRESLLAHLVG